MDLDDTILRPRRPEQQLPEHTLNQLYHLLLLLLRIPPNDRDLTDCEDYVAVREEASPYYWAKDPHRETASPL